jgi:hypothetical protein
LKESREEVSKLFYLSVAQREHVARHFLQTDLAGSHFYTDVIASPEALLLIINDILPEQVISQSKARSAFSFTSKDGLPIGTCGLAFRRDLREEQITRQVREGYTIEIGFVDRLPETNQFCVIADETTEGLSIITAFPGGYARPFAQKGQPPEEYALNKLFWEEHVLLKQKQS